jgi:hypothetical protein
MAKRARGSTTRPGQRPPLQRQPARPIPPKAVVAPRSETLTQAEEARAAELEAAILAEERQAEAATRRSRTARATAAQEPVRATSNLAVAAAEEYAYVARDVRRISLVGGSLVLVLFGLWVLAHLTGLGPF